MLLIEKIMKDFLKDYFERLENFLDCEGRECHIYNLVFSFAESRIIQSLSHGYLQL